jgi:hypothetical protein
VFLPRHEALQVCTSILKTRDKVPRLHWPVIAEDLTYMHYLPDILEDFADEWAVITERWDNLLQDDGEFSEYSDTQWGVESDFSFWGAANTPTAFATENNPVEQFNNVVKEDYTFRLQQSVPQLVTIIIKLVSDFSCKPDVFHTFPMVYWFLLKSIVPLGYH